MAIESSIQTIIEGLKPDATFMLASKFRANIQSFTIEPDELPFIVLDNELKKNAEIAQNGSINKEVKFIIWFLDQDSHDNTDAQTNAIQQAMEVIADRTALQIFRLPSIITNQNQKYNITPAFHVFNTNLSGVFLEMTVKENNLVSCTEPEPEPETP